MGCAPSTDGQRTSRRRSHHHSKHNNAHHGSSSQHPNGGESDAFNAEGFDSIGANEYVEDSKKSRKRRQQQEEEEEQQTAKYSSPPKNGNHNGGSASESNGHNPLAGQTHHSESEEEEEEEEEWEEGEEEEEEEEEWEEAEGEEEEEWEEGDEEEEYEEEEEEEPAPASATKVEANHQHPSKAPNQARELTSSSLESTGGPTGETYPVRNDEEDRESQLSSISSVGSGLDTSGNADGEHSHGEIDREGGGGGGNSPLGLPSFANSGGQDFVPPEQFIFGDFDVNTDTMRDTEMLQKSISRRDSRFQFGDSDALASEVEAEENIVQTYLKRKESLTGAASFRRPAGPAGAGADDFMWGDFALDRDQVITQHEIGKKFKKVQKNVDRVEVIHHLGQPDRIKCIAMMPGEGVYACCDCNETVMRTYDCKTGSLRLNFFGHQETITCVAFSPNSKHIATASADGGVVVWDTVTTKAQAILPHPKPVAVICFTGNSKSLVTSCRDNICRTWEIKKKKLLRTYSEHKAFVFALDTHIKYDVVVSGGVDGSLLLWTSLTAVTKAILRGHTHPVLSAKFSPQGTRIVSNDELTIRIWNTMTTVCIVTLSIDVLPVTMMGSFNVGTRRKTWITSAFCPVGAVLEDEAPSLHVIASCSDKNVHILQASTGKDVFSFACKAPVYQIAAGGRSKVVCGDCFGNVCVVAIK